MLTAPYFCYKNHKNLFLNPSKSCTSPIIARYK